VASTLSVVLPYYGVTTQPILQTKTGLLRGRRTNLLMEIAICFGVQNRTFHRKRGKLGAELVGAMVRNAAQQIMCGKNAEETAGTIIETS